MKILSVLLFLSTSAFAMVDMKNANYAETFTDAIIPGTGYDLKVTRTYNSRTLFNGMFGYGWCSDFETKLTPTPEGAVKLQECGAGQEVQYSPIAYGKKDVDSTVDAIIAKLKAAKKADESTIKTLRAQLTENPNYRASYAKEWGVTTPLKEGTDFLANGKESDHITFKGGQYVRYMNDGSNELFNKEGQLIQISDRNSNFLKFEYDKDNSLKSATDSSGRKLTFTYKNKKVAQISGPNGISVTYNYKNIEDLASVKNSWGNTYTHEYDELHNMTKTTFPDGTFTQLTYDKKKSWVTSFTARDKCVENYTYEDSKEDPQNHYWSIAKKTCGKDVVAENKYEFWYKKKADGALYLSRVMTATNSGTTDISYHEVFGKPVSISRNGETFTYEYSNDGLVKAKISKFSRLDLEYDKAVKKPSKVTATYFNDKGKKVTSKYSAFKYDNKGNLSYAENSDGQKVNMTYDFKGRMATITDQAHKVVKIEYEERFGKPSVVTRVGVGTIKFTYKPNGDMDKIEPANDAPTAMQVASTFNNLLDVIAPATAEIYN